MQKKSRKRGSGADSGRRAETPEAICAALRVMPVASAARETAQPAEALEGEAARRRSGSGRPQQQRSCKALLSEVERIEGAAAREARTRGWDLNETEDLMQRLLAETQCTLREAVSTLCERKAAHHAARVKDLAGEASEVDRTKCWSRQDCMVFRKELDWELQAFRGANTELELLVLPIDKRQAAHLRAEKVDATAHYARQVVERVLWDHDHGWEEPQRFGLDHHRGSVWILSI
jgi:hypothetical protein